MKVRAAVVGIVVLLVCGASALASGTHHHGKKACRATSAQREAALEFAVATAMGIERYLQVANAVGDGFITDGKPTNAIMHYDSKKNRRDGRFLDPLRPESLVYQNTYTGPRLLGALYSMGSSGRRGPAFGGCLTQWHHHRICKSPAGVGRPAKEGECPPGFEPKRTADMIHTWIVPMEGGAYAHRADDRYRCWLKTADCF